jgi:hypothetical protein
MFDRIPGGRSILDTKKSAWESENTDGSGGGYHASRELANVNIAQVRFNVLKINTTKGNKVKGFSKF